MLFLFASSPFLSFRGRLSGRDFLPELAWNLSSVPVASVLSSLPLFGDSTVTKSKTVLEVRDDACILVTLHRPAPKREILVSPSRVAKLVARIEREKAKSQRSGPVGFRQPMTPDEFDLLQAAWVNARREYFAADPGSIACKAACKLFNRIARALQWHSRPNGSPRTSH